MGTSPNQNNGHWPGLDQIDANDTDYGFMQELLDYGQLEPTSSISAAELEQQEESGPLGVPESSPSQPSQPSASLNPFDSMPFQATAHIPQQSLLNPSSYPDSHSPFLPQSSSQQQLSHQEPLQTRLPLQHNTGDESRLQGNSSRPLHPAPPSSQHVFDGPREKYIIALITPLNRFAAIQNSMNGQPQLQTQTNLASTHGSSLLPPRTPDQHHAQAGHAPSRSPVSTLNRIDTVPSHRNEDTPPSWEHNHQTSVPLDHLSKAQHEKGSRKRSFDEQRKEAAKSSFKLLSLDPAKRQTRARTQTQSFSPPGVAQSPQGIFESSHTSPQSCFGFSPTSFLTDRTPQSLYGTVTPDSSIPNPPLLSPISPTESRSQPLTAVNIPLESPSNQPEDQSRKRMRRGSLPKNFRHECDTNKEGAFCTCGQCFRGGKKTKMNNLRRHISEQNGRDSQKCPVQGCHYKTSRKENLNSHINHKHPQVHFRSESVQWLKDPSRNETTGQE